MTAPQLADRVRDICHAFGIRLIIKHRMLPHKAQAMQSTDGRFRAIVIPPVKDEAAYAVAMHELGHLLHPIGMMVVESATPPRTKRDIRLMLDREDAAWQWAMDNTADWTPTMESVRQMCFGAYLATAKRCGVTWRG